MRFCSITMRIKYFKYIFPFLFLWSVSALAGALQQVVVNPRYAVVGEQSTYSFTITTDPAGTAIPSKGSIKIGFDLSIYDFDLAPVIAVYSDSQTIFSGNFDDPEFVSEDGLQKIVCKRDGTGSTVQPGETFTITITSIINPPDVVQDAVVFVETLDHSDIVIDQGWSDPFDIGNPINSFDIDVSNLAFNAGSDFTVRVENALDDANSPTDGIVQLSFSDGQAHTAPDGFTQPFLTNVIVKNGEGEATVRLYKAETNIQLRGTVNGLSRTTGLFSIQPSTLASYNIDLDDTATNAGSGLDGNVTVTAYDAWKNIKTNYAGTIYFESTDNSAELTYDDQNPVAFDPVNDAGIKSISGSNFQFRSAGTQTITVTNGTIAKTSSAIQVSAGPLYDFALVMNSTQTAGVPFTLQVTNAVDQYLNPVSGNIVISAAIGGSSSPNGDAPRFTKIPVVNGTGEAEQTLYRVESVTLRGVDQTTGVTKTTGTITVLPGSLAKFELSNYPTSVAAGNSFNTDVIVRAIDAYGNEKTNYSGLIYFTSTDGSATLPGSTNFTSHPMVFGGNNFVFNTPGTQTFTVHDQSLGISTQSSSITVSALNILSITSATDRVSQGQSNVQVSMRVQNSGSQQITLTSAVLQFRSGTVDRDIDYQVPAFETRSIAANQIATLQFLVDVASTAALEVITINGQLDGLVGTSSISTIFTNPNPAWIVQQAANLAINSISIEDNQLAQGSRGIELQTQVSNNLNFTNSAPADLISSQFQFINNLEDVTSQFSVVIYDGNPETVDGGAVQALTYYITVTDQADLGNITVRQTINYSDANSGIEKQVVTQIPNLFQVVEGSSLEFTELTASQSTVTAGQLADWTVLMGIHNTGGIDLTLSIDTDKTYIRFKRGGTDYTESEYNISTPTALVEGGLTIPAGETRHLQFTVNETGTTTGPIDIYGRVEATNQIYTNSNISDVFGGFEVQTADDLRILDIIPSQTTATAGDATHPWTVAVVLKNQGGSTIEMDFDTSVLQFSNDTFVHNCSDALQNLGSQLKSNETDTLVFSVTETGSQVGDVLIGANIHYKNVNTQAAKEITASEAMKAVVSIQEASDFKITNIKAVPEFVTFGVEPNWWVTVHVANDGGADVEIDLTNAENTWVRLLQEGVHQQDFTFTLPEKLSASNSIILKAGESDSLIFKATTIGNVLGDLFGQAQVRVREPNRNQFFVEQFTSSTKIITVQEPANIEYVENSLQPTTVSAGAQVGFTVDVSNIGGSDLILNTSQTKFQFNDGLHFFSAALDPAYDNRVPGGQTVTINFLRTLIPLAFQKGQYLPQLIISGTENNNAFSDNIELTTSLTVSDPGKFSLNHIVASTPSVTIGQTNQWKIDFILVNNGSNNLQYDTAELTFSQGTNDVSEYFTFDIPNSFVSESNILSAGQTDTIRIAVTNVSAETPNQQTVLNGSVFMTDLVNTDDHPESTLPRGDEIQVQNPAELEFTRLHLSQSSITRGQTTPWKVTLHLENAGEADLLLDSENTKLSFGIGDEYFNFTKPGFFDGSNSKILSGGSRDSLIYNVQLTSAEESIVGITTVNATVRMTEVNRNLIYSFSTAPGNGQVSLAIQDSAAIRLDQVIIDVPSDSFVNSEQSFYVKALVTNPGNPESGDTVQQTTIRFYSESDVFQFSPEGQTFNIESLGPGESVWTEPGVRVNAPDLPGFKDNLVAKVETAIARNTKQSAKILTPLDSSITVHVQEPGNLVLHQVYTSVDTVIPGTSVDWQIFLDVENNTEQGGSLKLKQPTKDDITFNPGEGYVFSPRAVTEDDLVLKGGERDTLIFDVTSNGPAGGEITITGKVSATDLNDANRTIATQAKQTSVQATNRSNVMLVKTFVDPDLPVVVNDTGYVNISQDLIIKVMVQNVGAQELDTVKVQLTAPSSAIINGIKESHRLGVGQTDTLTFNLTAADAENLTGEKIEAHIIRAVARDGSIADISSSNDNFSIIKIHEPARLQIIAVENLAPSSEGTVNTGQSFDVSVKVKNTGSEAAKDVQVSLGTSSETLGKVLTSPITFAQNIQGNQEQELSFRITAGSESGNVEFTANINNALGVHNNQGVTILDPEGNNITQAIVENPAVFEILSVSPQEDIINAGDELVNWNIFVQVTNTGSSDLEFVNINAENIVFSINDVVDADYDIAPPQKLKNQVGLVLPGGAIDSLVYIVRNNGKLAGTGKIDVALQARDKNLPTDSPVLTDNASADIIVRSVNARVQVKDTEIVCNTFDNNGIGLVNRGQAFQVQVKVKAGQVLGVDSVKVELDSREVTSNTVLSMVKPDTVIIPRIAKDSTAYAVFDVTAVNDLGVNEELSELYTAKILSAKAIGSDEIAQIQEPDADDDQARIRIQEPARVNISVFPANSADSVVTASSKFKVTVKVERLGTSQVKDGNFVFTPPEGYRIFDGIDYITDPQTANFSLTGDDVSKEVNYELESPDTDTAPLAVKAAITETPKDLNTLEDALIEVEEDSFLVETKTSILLIDYFTIIEPEGAKDSVLSTEQTLQLEAKVKTSKNLTNRKVKLLLPAIAGSRRYSLADDDSLEKTVDQDSATLSWTIFAPSAEVSDNHTLQLELKGEENGKEKVSKASITIKKVVTKAILNLEALSVIPLTTMTDGATYLSTGQTATLQARVTNLGSAGLDPETAKGKLKLDLLDSGLSLADGESATKDFDINENIGWTITAPNEVLQNKRVKVEIDSDSVPKDENSNKSVEVETNTRELIVYTQEGGYISVDSLWVSNPVGARDNKLSTNQTFYITAEISSGQVAEDISAQIIFSSEEFDAVNPVNQDIAVGDDQRVTWKVTAPGVTGDGNVQIKVNAKDLRSGADLEIFSDAMDITVENQAVVSITPKISAPEGLVDRVSTSQYFTLTTSITNSGDAGFADTDSFVVELAPLPVGFSLSGERRLSVTVADVKNNIFPEWELQAPAAKPEGLSKFEFNFIQAPVDQNSGTNAKISKDTETFTLQTLNKAGVELLASMDQDVFIDSGTVRVGSEFQVVSYLSNIGESDLIGSYQVKIKLSDNGFTTKGDTIKTAAGANDAISWTIQAPKYKTDVPDTIKFYLLEAPNDTYTKQQASIDKDLAKILVSSEAGMVVIEPYVLQEKSVVSKGSQNVKMMGFKARNKDAASSSVSIIDSLKIFVKDKKGEPVSPASVFSRVAAVRHSDPAHVFAWQTNFGTDFILLDLKSNLPDTLKGTEPDSIDIVADIGNVGSAYGFQLYINSPENIRASDVSGLPLTIVDSNYNQVLDLGISSKLSVVVEEQLEKTFCNYPNPFGRPDRTETKFLYYLSQPSDVEIKIFTLTGELVRSWSFSKSSDQLQTSEGVHQGDVIWDGTNGQNFRVMNGVYLAYIITETETAITKIAVVK